MQESPLQVGDAVEVVTERIAYGGDAVARHEGLAIFIPFAAPGERLRVRVTERKKSFARAVIEKVIDPSPARREPPCGYFGYCGGCQLQHLDYQAQLDAKAGFIRDAITRIAAIEWPHPIEVRHAAEFGYRARAQVKIEAGRAGLPAKIGFNRPGSHSVTDVRSCPILEPRLDAALGSLRAEMAGNRMGRRLSEIEMAAGDTGISIDPPLPGMGEDVRDVLERRVAGATYRFGATSFFQVNPLLLESLVEEAVKEERGRLALDLYAGVGLFTIQLSKHFDRVIGVESDGRASAFARENIEANGASNIDFYNARTEAWLEEAARRLEGSGRGRPDLILLDPPRGGAAEALDRIIRLGPPRITYVSCDPTTLARDLRNLAASGYRLSRVTGFDLFPQTFHVETVAQVERNPS